SGSPLLLLDGDKAWLVGIHSAVASDFTPQVGHRALAGYGTAASMFEPAARATLGEGCPLHHPALTKARSGSFSSPCRRAWRRVLSASRYLRVVRMNFSRISSALSGLAGVPLKCSTRRVNVRPSLSATVTVLASAPWECGSGSTVMVTREASERMSGSRTAASVNEAGSRASR